MAVVVYLPALGFQFVWDDSSLITENTLAAESSPWDFLGRSFWAGSPEPPANGDSYYRPLTVASFWLDRQLAGLNPAWFHLVNILLNVGVSVLLAMVVLELLGSPLWAGLAGLFFTLHPTHVEAVAFVSGRTDLLAGLFMSLSLLALLRARRGRPRIWLPTAVVAYPLALMSKETALLFPALVLCVPLLEDRGPDRRDWQVFAAMLATALGYLLLRAAALGSVLSQTALSARPLEVLNTLGLYARMLFWPFHHQVKIPSDPVWSGATPYLLPGIGLLGLVPLLSLGRRFRPALLGAGWLLLSLLPVANLVGIGPQAAERLVYLPSAGLAIILVTFRDRLPGWIGWSRQVAVAGLSVACAVFAVDTSLRLPVWRNEITLYSAMVREAPTAPSAYANLANALREQDPDSAIALYRRSLELDPGQFHARTNLGILLSGRGEHQTALELLGSAVRLRPRSAQAHNNLGLALLAAGQPDSALGVIEDAIGIEPDNRTLRTNRATALQAAGQEAAARAELLRLAELDPDDVHLLLQLVGLEESAGRLDSAALWLRRAVQLTPADPVVVNRLGTLLVMLGDSARARACYHRALAADSSFVPALFNAAVLDASLGDSASARQLVRRAAELRPDLAAVRELRDRLQ